MGSNGGTGKPMWFRCWRCRLRYGTKGYFGTATPKEAASGRLSRVTLTGRVKAARRHGNASGRNSEQEREYVCGDCDHRGWSRHTDLERKAVTE